ncbi:MAG: glycosyltransferase family 4 protein [Deltaproteobacteria bacterium]|nr:glycosyltransferase family 4 protein [Deltaproteobacteria bacterium]
MTDLANIVSPPQLYFLLLEFGLGLFGAWLVSRFARRLGLIDTPSARSSHIIPTPRGGGVGILAAFIAACFWLGLNYIFCLPVVLLASLSFIGDRTDISPAMRLIMQFSAAFIVIFMLPESPLFISLPFHYLSLNWLILLMLGIMAAVFIVGTANFYNFMDGIDGIAGITAIVAMGLLTAYGISSGKDSRYTMLALGLAVACLGFLPFNIPKAKIFMGDVGSILLGFVFAVIVVLFSLTSTEFLVLSSFLFPFYADELTTMATRIRLREDLTRPHRRHLYQILANEAGIAHWKVAFAYGVFQLIVGLSMWQIARFGLVPLIGALTLLAFATLYLTNKVRRQFIVTKNKILLDKQR